MSSDRPASDDAGRYRVDARTLPFTPSWFWEVIDTAENTFVENSLALGRTVYESPGDALAAGQEYLGGGLRQSFERGGDAPSDSPADARRSPGGSLLAAFPPSRIAPAKPALERRAA